VCSVDGYMCTAHRLLEIIQHAAPTEQPTLSSGTLIVPPQDTETNTALAELAYEASARALDIAGQALIASCAASALDDPLRATLPGEDATTIPTVAEYLAAGYMEAVNVAIESTDESLSASMAVADAFASREPDSTMASHLSLLPPFASRSAAAHLLVGGDAGLPGVDIVSSGGWFDQDPLNAEAQQALQFLRICAPPPRVVEDIEGVSLTAFLVNGWPDVDPDDGYTGEDSIQVRLGAFLSDATLAAAPSQSAFLTRLGLSESAFVAARAWLARERVAFSRSLDARARPERLASGAMTPFPLFAATRTPPRLADRVFYGAVARFSEEGDGAGLAVPSFAGSLGGQKGFGPLNWLIDGATTGVRRILATTRLDGPALASAREALALLPGARPLRVEGRVNHLVYVGEGTAATIVVLVGVEHPESVLVVRGRAGLECALLGSVEGAPCVLSDHLAETSYPNFLLAGSELPPEWGYDTAHLNIVTLEAGGSPRATADLLFYVRPRDGAATGVAGTFEAVAGVQLELPPLVPGPLVLHHSVSLPVVPELDGSATRAIGPNPDGIGYATSCSGVPFDQLIPLENELTSDGDPVESSWRRYLSLARSAADEADRLGEDLIANGLVRDQRSEAAIDELERICGVSLNITFADIDMLDRIRSPEPDGSCIAGYVRSAGDCVLDPIALALSRAASEPDAERLEACLGGSSTVPWAVIGDSALCIWHDPTDVNSVCAGRNADAPCPFLADGVDDPGTSINEACDHSPIADAAPGVTFTVLTIDQTLGLFHIPLPDDVPAPGTVTGRNYPCQALAQWRATNARAAEIVSDTWFSPTELARDAGRLGWTPFPGNYSRVTWDGTSLVGTGSAITGPGSGWPCGLDAPENSRCVGVRRDDPNSIATLFCLQDACGNRDADPYEHIDHLERARTNDMLARAVLAVRFLAGIGLQGGAVSMPYYPRSTETGFVDNPEFDSGTPRVGSTAPLQRGTSGSYEGTGLVREFMDLDLTVSTVFPNAPFDPSSCRTAFLSPTIEWATCPYDQAGCREIFDDGPDCDDGVGNGNDRNLPMATRRLPELGVTNMGTFALEMWSPRVGPAPRGFDDRIGALYHGRAHQLIHSDRSTRDETAVFFQSTHGFFDDTYGPRFPLGRLTTYWRRSGCGGLGGGNCAYTTNAGESGRTRAEEDRVMAEIRSCTGPNCALTGCSCGGDFCSEEYFNCADEAESVGTDFATSLDGNRAFIGREGLTTRDVLNGLELLCYAGESSDPDLTNFGCTAPPEINTINDAFRAESFLRCRESGLRSLAAHGVIRGLPARVVELLRQDGSATLGALSGDYAVQVTALRQSIVGLRDAEDHMASTVHELANSISDLRRAVGRSRRAHEIEDLTLASTIFDRVTNCVTASLNAAAESIGATEAAGSGLRAGSAAATCINSGVQIGLSARLADLRHEDIGDELEGAFTGFDSQFNRLSGDLLDQGTAIASALEGIDASLTEIHDLQDEGRRALGRALLLEADSSGRRFAVDTVERRRYSTSLNRYTEARERAIRLAFIAKIALEQRLGMRLADMTDPLVTVDAPARWEADLCTLPAIDYDRLRNASVGALGERESDSSEFVAPDGYEGAYVGDYVRRLEQVFESYNFAYPFQDGTDTVVLSLRDDVTHTRAACAVPVSNLLLQSGHLDVMANALDGGWERERCEDLTGWPSAVDDPDAPSRPNCVSATVIDPALEAAYADPIGPESADFGRVPGYRVTFGNRVPVILDDEPHVGMTPETRIVQWVSAGGGVFRLSWYGRPSPGASGADAIPPASALRVVLATDFITDPETGEVTWTESPAVLRDHGTSGGGGDWVRYHAFVDIPEGATAGIYVSTGLGASDTPRFRTVDVAAVMFENVTADLLSSSPGAGTFAELNRPGPYFDTQATRTRVLDACEDTTGERFRNDAWTWGCTRRCPDGYDGDCPSADLRCYHQLSFSVDSSFVERIATSASAGFVSGNYNYRIESIGVNLVGENLRDCTGVAAAGGCYASGNFEYAVLHSGPYFVRNARGALYSAPLFPGRFGGRALAAERYLTNPLGSADRSLIEPYARIEMRGRPLGGTLAVRVWHDPELVWDNVRDVQVMLGYRYWTPQR